MSANPPYPDRIRDTDSDARSPGSTGAATRHRHPWAIILAAAVLTAGFFRAAAATPPPAGSPEGALQPVPVPAGQPAVAGVITRVEVIEVQPDRGRPPGGVPRENPDEPVGIRAHSPSHPPGPGPAPRPAGPASQQPRPPEGEPVADRQQVPPGVPPTPGQPVSGGGSQVDGQPENVRGETNADGPRRAPQTSPPAAHGGGGRPTAQVWRLLIEAFAASGETSSGRDADSPPAQNTGPLPIWLTVDPATLVGAEVGDRVWPLPPGRILEPGQRVRAWVRGGIRESYPAQAHGAAVLIEPSLRGVLEAREPLMPGPDARPGPAALRLLVRGQAIPPHAMGPSGRIWITVDQHSTVVAETGRRLPATGLAMGTPVTVWIGGPVLLSDPPQAYASLVAVTP